MKPKATTPATGRVSAIVLAALLLFAVPGMAQPTPAGHQATPASSDAKPELTLAQAEAALAALEADTGLDDRLKAALRSRYEAAIKALQEAAVFADLAVNYRQAIDTAPARTAALDARLQALPSTTSAARITPLPAAGDLDKLIDARRATLSDLNRSLAEVRAELARVRTRPFEISTRIPAVQRELSDLGKELTAAALAEDSTSASRVAEHMLLQARQSRLLREAELLEQEQLSQSARENLLQLEEKLLQRQVENAEAALRTLQALSAERLLSKAEHVGVLADRMPQDIPEDDEQAQQLAAEVRALAREFETVVQQLQQVQAAQADISTRLEHLNARYASVSEELQISVGGSGMAQVLLDMQRRYSGQRAYLKDLALRVAPLDETRLASLRARTRLRNQPEVEDRFAGHPVQAVATLVATRRQVLQELDARYGNLTRALAAFEADRKNYLARAEEVRSYVSAQLFGFGMRGAPPVSAETLLRIPAALGWFVQGGQWLELGRGLRAAVTGRPLSSTLVVLITLALLFTRRRISAALERTGTRVRRISTDRYAHTGEALFWTLLLAAPVPLLVGYAGWALAQSPVYSGWIQGIAGGLQLAAWIGLALGFLAAVCHPNGLGADHFRWQLKPLARLRASIRSFGLVYIPALLITFSGLYTQAPEFLFSIGRISFIVAHVWTMLVFWQLLNFSTGVLAEFLREKPGSLIARWRYLWFPLTLAYPLALAVIAGFGYIYTAVDLSIGLLLTAAYVVAGVILYRLARRWFRIRQRRLALAEALEKRRVRQEAAAAGEGQAESGGLVAGDAEAEQELDLVTISAQTLHLLRLFFSLGVATAVLLLWSEHLPLIATLDGIGIPLTGGLTLLGLMKSVLIVVVTYIAAVNLPGLLELAVLRATRIDAGTRHAISTLFQYAVIAIGLVLFFNVLSVDWAKLGWIAAALSVGIGFGLQEVVANFVCGLILLFERPIRVGDVVTVNNVTGTVTRIQIRATTITNGDRQAFVVPNKSLITGSLLNWTLNTALNRIIIRLGVASDSDTDRARQILLEVAADHPHVLADPAPMATFEAFGDSSLNLVLYAFLADLENRLSTISELYTEINRRFTAAGIEIPNPQMDLHLHSRRDESHGVNTGYESKAGKSQPPNNYP